MNDRRTADSGQRRAGANTAWSSEPSLGVGLTLPVRSPTPSLGNRSRFLILVKTYPSPSRKYGETVCCAGIDAATGRWIRMYPVNFRSLEEFRRFAKWQFVEASWEPAVDHRPESRHIHQDSIQAGQLLPAGAKGWRERRQWLDPLVDASLHSLEEDRLTTGRSLGVIRPAEIRELIVRDAESWDPSSEAELAQLTLSWTGAETTPKTLERLSFDFIYDFTCRDVRCRGHQMKVLDWEMAETFRNFRRLYGPKGWEAKFRQKYAVWVPSRDVHFVMGTHHQYGTWLLVGVLYPPYVKVDERDRRTRRDRIREQGTMTLPGFGLEAEYCNGLVLDPVNHRVEVASV